MSYISSLWWTCIVCLFAQQIICFIIAGVSQANAHIGAPRGGLPVWGTTLTADLRAIVATPPDPEGPQQPSVPRARIGEPDILEAAKTCVRGGWGWDDEPTESDALKGMDDAPSYAADRTGSAPTATPGARDSACDLFDQLIGSPR